MKLATTTGDFGRFPIDNETRVRLVHNAGFRCIDLSMYTPSKAPELFADSDWREAVSRLKALEDELGIRYVQAHSPGGNPLNDDGGALLADTVRSIEICAMLGIPNTVVHGGHRQNISKEEALEKNRTFFRALIPVMEETGVNVLIENSTKVNMGDQYYPITGEELLEFIRFMDHPQFHACWDTGHANCEGPQYEEIRTLGEQLYAVHFNDNRGAADEHILPYMGTMNSDEVLHALIDSGYKGYLTFEADSTFRPAKYWLGDRKRYAADHRLSEATLEMQITVERLMYQIGEHMLRTYGIFEE